MRQDRPKFMREFRLRKVRPRIRELFRQAVELHDPQLREGCPRDLIDEFLEIHRRDPQFLPETDLISSVVAPYIQSLDPIAGTLGFALLHLLAEPRYAEMLQHEADRAFDAGLVTLLHCAEIDRYPVGDSRVRITSYPSLRPYPKCRIQIKRHRLAAR